MTPFSLVSVLLSLILLFPVFPAPGAEEAFRTLTPTSKNTLYDRTVLPERLPPGQYRITTEIRAENPSPNASVAVYVESEPRSGENPALWQSVSLNSHWTALTLPLTLRREGRVALVFNKIPSSGTCSKFLCRTAKIQALRIEPGKNLLRNNGFFDGEPGETPAEWRVEYGWTKECGLTREFGFENSSSVMKLQAGTKAVSLQSMKYPVPAKGAAELRVWARSLGPSAAMTLHLLGDSYAWGVNRLFSLTRTWREYRIRGDFPANPKSPFFWSRIDIAPGEGALIGRVSLNYADAPQTVRAQGKNLIFNPSFQFGTLGWQLRADEGQFSELTLLERMLDWKAPRLSGESLILDPDTMLQSRQFPVVPGENYTILLRMKNAVRGRNALCRAYLFDGQWQGFAGTFRLTDEYRTYRFSGKARRSLYNRMYLRVDAVDHPLQLERVQAAAGDETGFEEPELSFGVLGKNILADTERNAPLDVRVLTGRGRMRPLELVMEIRDAWGALCRSERFRFAPGADQRQRFTVNPDGRRGVFHITLKAENRSVHFPYAVLKDLSGLKLAEPPLAGHLAPFVRKYDRDLLNRFLAFDQMTYTRFFGKEVLDLSRHPRLLEAFRTHHRFNVLCLPGLQDQEAKFALAKTLTPELEREFADQVRRTVSAFRGGIQGVELFNEPELWRYRNGPEKNLPTMSPEKVARCYQIARKVIREIDPSIRLLGPVAWRDYGFRFLEKGGADAIDIYAFHGYCESPSLFHLYGKIMEYRNFLKKRFGREIPIWNTEQYFGIRGSGLPDHDSEVSRHYFKDTELEHAAVCADNLIHHAAAGARWSSMVLGYFLHGIPGQPEQMVFDSLGAVNAAQEFLANASRGEEANLGEAVRSFVFPDAQGGVLVTLSAADPAAKGSVTIPDSCRAFDMFGNPISGKTAPVSMTPLYLRVPKSNWKKILNSLEFRDLGDPFALRLSMGGRNLLNVSLTNRTNRGEKVELLLTGVPKELELEKKTAVVSLAPGEKRVLAFPIRKSEMLPMKRYDFKIGLRSRFGYATRKSSLSVLFAHRSENGENLPWVELNGTNLSANYHPTEKWSGPRDLSAKFRTWWNERGFGVDILVNDDHFVFPDNAPAAWRNDSVQLYFDMKRDATPTSGKEEKNMGDDCDYIISLLNGKTPAAYLNNGCDARFIGEANQTRGVDSALRLSCERPSSGTLLYRIFFPAETLPYIAFREGVSFGFSLLVNDDDGKGRKDGLTLAPRGTEPYRNPHLYKDLVLIR